MALLSVNGIEKKERGEYLVRNISFTQEQFQKIAIAGETGSGKTTLLKIIAGLLQRDNGEVFFNNERVLGPLEKLIPGHQQIAYLSQYFELRNNYRVEEELDSKNLLSGEEAHTLYTICRIEHLLKRKTNEVSGGERQRIVLAKILITSPNLLLLDEPFSNLDAANKKIIKSVIDDISEKLGITCILVSHDAMDVLGWADSIIVMKDGNIIQQDTPTIIYHQPVNEYCAALFGDYNLVTKKNIAQLGWKCQHPKQLLVRPEEIKICKDDNKDLQGEIKKISFGGSYYLLEVEAGDQLLLVKTNNTTLTARDIIHLKLQPRISWYI